MDQLRKANTENHGHGHSHGDEPTKTDLDDPNVV